MPVERGKDSKGAYYRWGDKGKKYYYQAGNVLSRTRSYQQALKQGRAIAVSKRSRS